MTNRKHREEFISTAARLGVPHVVITGLLRHAATLHRLAEAQCNGDWPYNGDRDRPSMAFRPCDDCQHTGCRACSGTGIGCEACPKSGCVECQGTGQLQTNGRERMRWDARYQVCPQCEQLAARSTLKRAGGKGEPVCPDCRSVARVNALMADTEWRAVVNGDPRGCVLAIARRGVADEDIQNGRAQSRGDQIGVPA
jgi:hypothetical protein